MNQIDLIVVRLVAC